MQYFKIDYKCNYVVNDCKKLILNFDINMYVRYDNITIKFYLLNLVTYMNSDLYYINSDCI